MINKLSILQSEGIPLNSDVKNFIGSLQKQSETYKRDLIEDLDPHGAPNSESLTTEETGLVKHGSTDYLEGQSTSTFSRQTKLQNSKEARYSAAPENKYSIGKRELVSPPQEGKYSKKTKPFGFGKKTNLQIDVNVANEESNEAGAPGSNILYARYNLIRNWRLKP